MGLARDVLGKGIVEGETPKVLETPTIHSSSSTSHAKTPNSGSLYLHKSSAGLTNWATTSQVTPTEARSTYQGIPRLESPREGATVPCSLPPRQKGYTGTLPTRALYLGVSQIQDMDQCNVVSG